jgi:hypothetical protein
VRISISGLAVSMIVGMLSRTRNGLDLGLCEPQNKWKSQGEGIMICRVTSNEVGGCNMGS